MSSTCDLCPNKSNAPLFHFGNKPNGDWNWRCANCIPQRDTEGIAMYGSTNRYSASTQAPKTRTTGNDPWGGV